MSVVEDTVKFASTSRGTLENRDGVLLKVSLLFDFKYCVEAT